MKFSSFGIFRRITFLVFVFTTFLGVLFIGLTYYATIHYHLASTQLLNKDVASHIVKFASPFDNDGINKRRADSVFTNAMILNPSAEVYFLDIYGNVLDFYGPRKNIRLWKIPLENIHKYISSKGEEYIKAEDPRDPSHPKIFSAAEVINNSKKLGYIYVIFGSNQYRNVNDLLFSSHISNLAMKTFIFITILSVFLSWIYIFMIQKSFNRIMEKLNKFQEGDLSIRFKTKDNDELEPISRAFNKMAELLAYNINEVKRSENQRRDFIAHVSHDLLTPLSIARGYGETLFIKKDRLSAKEMNDYLEIITKKILQVEFMVRDLSEISKIESAQFKARKEPFVLSEIVQENVNTFQLSASKKNISLKCVQCMYHVWINADVKLMERVIQNLIDNAIKNTLEYGEIKVALEVKNNNLIFKIENTAIPLNQNLLEWINDPADNTMRHIEKPVPGLGLLITKKILSLHGSLLNAQSNGQDSNIFTFSMEIYSRE